MSEPKRILVAPLDWGLGHATRCVPLIRRFRDEGHVVFLAASGHSEKFLHQEFPDLTIIPKKGYGIQYSLKTSMTLMMLFQSLKILMNIFREYQWLKKIIQQYKIDEVVSDNCYGLWNKNIHSIFMTHQLMIKCPAGLKWMEPLLHRIVIRFASRYDECWIPDVEREDNLSGDLSHLYPVPGNAKFIGWCSRFALQENKLTTENEYDLCILISGPEPHRSVFESESIEALKTFRGNAILILGKPGNEILPELKENVRVFNHLDTNELRSVIINSKKIICRSGYSTIMDLRTINKGALLIPTPGQTEQEYLAEYLDGKNGFEMLKKTETLSEKIQEYSNEIPFSNEMPEDVLISAY
ncbi:MAG: glycosyltransferase [Bacteroidetes bacterium]|nr:glycosyltransferase [Bacteroidota bacterium]